MRRLNACLLVLMLASGRALAGGGLLGIDHEWAYDNSGIWKRSYQLDLEYGAVATEAVGALWLGNDDPLGHEFWQGIDSTAVSGVAAQLLKYASAGLGRFRTKGLTVGSRAAAARAFRVER